MSHEAQVDVGRGEKPGGFEGAVEEGLGPAVRAELVRARGSASSRFVLFGLAICVLQGLGWWSVANRPMSDWDGLLGWQSLYATGLFAPLNALLAATTVSREAAAREGGTWTRPLSPRTALVARVLVLAWQSLLFQGVVTMPLIAFGLLGGLTDAPIGRFVAMWLTFWATSLLPLALGFVLARRIGMIATLVLTLGWQIGGTLVAESPTWWAQPWSWGVHAMLPILGVHRNGVRLEPDSPLWSLNPWWPALMSVALAGVVVGVAAALARVDTTPRRIGLGRLRRRSVVEPEPAPAVRGDLDCLETAPRAGSVPTAPVQRGRGRPVAAQLVLLRATAIPALVVAALLAITAVGVVWNSTYVTGFGTWLVLPLGSCILACLVWGANSGGWRVAALRERTTTLAAAMITVCLVLLGLVVACLTLVAALSRGGGIPFAFPATAFLTGAMTLTVSLWLATRFGAGAAIGATLVVLVFSLVFGGTYLSEGPLWLVGVLGWPLTVTSVDRLLVALTVGLVVCVGAFVAWLRALARAAR